MLDISCKKSVLRKGIFARQFSCNGRVLGKMIVLFPPATKLRQGNVFTPVCHSVHRGCLTDTPGQTAPLDRQLRTDTPWTDPADRHPLCRHPLGRQSLGIHFWTDISLGRDPPGKHPPLPSACWDTPPCPVHAGIHTPPPCTVHAGIRSTSGQYASYWNAFLLLIESLLMICTNIRNFFFFLTSVQHYLLCTKQNMCHLFPW